MRLCYLGSPDDAVPPLRALVAAGHDVALVITQPDRRRGRGGASTPSPVRRAAEALGLRVATPARAVEVLDDLRRLDAELGVVVAFGQLLRTRVLEATRHGFVNLHFSLLPRWRGAAPVERAILAGDRETGVCLMQVVAELDAGPLYGCRRTTIGAAETAGELRARLVALGTELLLERLPSVPTTEPVPQRGEPTYAAKLTPDEFRLDPSMAPEELLARVRAGNPRPGAWVEVGGRRVKILRAHLDDGRLVPDEVQPEGRRPMSYTAWRAGHRVPLPFP